MRKLSVLLLLLLLLLDSLLAATSLSAVLKDANNKNREGTPVSFSISPSELTYDPEVLVNGDNTVYHKDLSVLLSLLSADIYDNAVLDTTGTTKETDNTAIYKALGLRNVEETTIRDVSDVVLAMDTYADGGKDYSIVFVTIQGTNGTYAQWSSNFDIGADTTSYLGKNGDNGYWKNKTNHCGFDIAANKVQEVLESYLKNYVKTKEPQTVLVFT
ncbi:MAG: hypothetical protein KBS81_04785, partial [Spirochaetales bacterium]|nr:hypothetical protein [Candidatus Physcosoma equi]